MIILDTNVISEVQRPMPDENVLAWLDNQDPKNLFITAITVGELMYGAYALPKGKRAKKLQDVVANLVEDQFYGRILEYDATAAYFYGMGMADRKKEGVNIGIADGQIASIAIANNNAPIATRDVNPFKSFGLEVINPWDVSDT